MAKGCKALFAMVAAHAAVAYAAKGQVVVGEVQHGVIDATTAKGKRLQPPLLSFPAFREQVTCQRFFKLLHNGQRLIKICKADDGQNWPKGFILHQWGRKVFFLNQRGLHPFAFYLTTVAQVSPCKQCLQSLQMVVVDDVGIAPFNEVLRQH